MMDMVDQQTIFPADEICLFDPITHCLLQDILAERHAGTRRLPTPFQPCWADAVLYSFVDLLREIAQRMHDRFANRRPHDRVQRITIGFRVISECLLQTLADRLGQRLNQLAVLLMTLVDCLRQNIGNIGRSDLATFDPLRYRVQRLFLGAEQQFF